MILNKILNGKIFAFKFLFTTIFSVGLFFLFSHGVSAADWYVRASSTPGSYGLESGASYDDAFNGWSDIVWGGAGVSASDTLYVCGAHNYNVIVAPGISGATFESRTTINGDCPSDSGSITFTGAVYLNINQDYFNIKNLTINASSGYTALFHQKSYVTYENIIFNGGSYGINIKTGSSSIPMTDNSIIDCSFNGQSVAGIRWLPYTIDTSILNNTLIQGNNFSNILDDAIEIRSESDAPNADLSNITILDNTFLNCAGTALWIYGDGTSLSFGWEGLIIRNNVINSCGNGMGIGGFGANDYGSNDISGNIIRGTTKPMGGIDVFYMKYLDIYNNIISDGSTATIDGNGILLDHGNVKTRVYDNAIDNMVGKAGVANSGVALMVLDSTDSLLYNNKGAGNKHGLWFGAWPMGSVFYNNTLIENSEVGLWVANTIDETEIGSCATKNNILTGSGISYGLNDQSTGGGDSVWNHNVLYDFATNYFNHDSGLGDIISNPFLFSSSDFQLQSISPAIDAGISIASRTVDYLGNPIYGTPDIGAYEYQPPYIITTDKIDISSGARIYADGKFRDLAATSSNLADLSITPYGGTFPIYDATTTRSAWMDISIAEWNKIGDYKKTWTESSDSIGNATTTHAIGDLAVGQYYEIYYTHGTGTRTYLGLRQADMSSKISFDYTGGYSTSTFEIVPSIISEITPVATSTNDQTPDYTFNSTLAGTIIYSGDCTSSTTIAIVGDNTISFDSLVEGLHDNCSIKIMDGNGDLSASLNISSFNIDITSVVRTDGLPSGKTISRTKQAELRLMTNEIANCRYSTSANTTYADMTETFATTNDTSHLAVVTDLDYHITYHYYVKCRDIAMNDNIDDYDISFTLTQQSSGMHIFPALQKVATSTTATGTSIVWEKIVLGNTIENTDSAGSSTTTNKVINSESKSIIDAANELEKKEPNQKLIAKVFAKLEQIFSKLSKENGIVVKQFISHGTPSTQKLGIGERAAIVSIFGEVYGHAPESKADWEDLLRIANGENPKKRNLNKEKEAEKNFRKIFSRKPELSKQADKTTLSIMTYGVLPANRNLNKESDALSRFASVFTRLPKNSTDWNNLKGIAYGAVK